MESSKGLLGIPWVRTHPFPFCNRSKWRFRFGIPEPSNFSWSWWCFFSRIPYALHVTIGSWWWLILGRGILSTDTKKQFWWSKSLTEAPFKQHKELEILRSQKETIAPSFMEHFEAIHLYVKSYSKHMCKYTLCTQTIHEHITPKKQSTITIGPLLTPSCWPQVKCWDHRRVRSLDETCQVIQATIEAIDLALDVAIWHQGWELWNKNRIPVMGDYGCWKRNPPKKNIYFFFVCFGFLDALWILCTSEFLKDFKEDVFSDGHTKCKLDLLVGSATAHPQEQIGEGGIWWVLILA